MKKEVIISTIALLLTVAPVYAVSSHASNSQVPENHGSEVSQGHKVLQRTSEDNDTVSVITVTPSPTATATPTPTPTQDNDDDTADDKDVEGVQTPQQCDPSASWKNHGAYVACVAHLRLGGTAVSEAAKSSVGKKAHATPSATPSLSPTETPTGTPTASFSSEAASNITFKPLIVLQEVFAHLLANLPFMHHRS